MNLAGLEPAGGAGGGGAGAEGVDPLERRGRAVGGRGGGGGGLPPARAIEGPVRGDRRFEEAESAGPPGQGEGGGCAEEQPAGRGLAGEAIAVGEERAVLGAAAEAAQRGGGGEGLEEGGLGAPQGQREGEAEGGGPQRAEGLAGEPQVEVAPGGGEVDGCQQEEDQAQEWRGPMGAAGGLQEQQAPESAGEGEGRQGRREQQRPRGS